jgi:cytochrome c-type biogenesis protein CcmH
MTAFALLAAASVAAALLFVLPPLMRARRAPMTQARAANLNVYRGQLAELERDLALGTLDRGQYEAARAELQRRLLEEVGGEPATAGSPGSARSRDKSLALVIGVALPVVAAMLYWQLGEPRAIGAAGQAAQEPPPMTQEQFEAMTAKLAQRMADKPDDPVGWLMLGRAYKALGRPADAVGAFEQANRRRPGDAEILIEYAEAKAQVAGSLAGEPRRLLEQALAVAPNDPKALTLAGAAAFEARDYDKAIAYWERLAARMPPESELGKAIATGLERARSLRQAGAGVQRAAPGAVLQGRVSLAAALKNRAAPDDTVFVYARAADGPRMPLAVARKRVKDLPADFRLDDSMAMTPELKLSAFERVVVSARVSRSGSATPRSGDLQGESVPVAPGAGRVSVVIDHVLQ